MFQADAIEYYTEEERLLKEACESEKAQAFQEPLGIAFISFDADHMAARYWSHLLTTTFSVKLMAQNAEIVLSL